MAVSNQPCQGRRTRVAHRQSNTRGRPQTVPCLERPTRRVGRLGVFLDSPIKDHSDLEKTPSSPETPLYYLFRPLYGCDFRIHTFHFQCIQFIEMVGQQPELALGQWEEPCRPCTPASDLCRRVPRRILCGTPCDFCTSLFTDCRFFLWSWPMQQNLRPTKRA